MLERACWIYKDGSGGNDKVYTSLLKQPSLDSIYVVFDIIAKEFWSFADLGTGDADILAARELSRALLEQGSVS